MPSVRRIKSVKWDEDDLDDSYSDDYSDSEEERFSKLKISNSKTSNLKTQQKLIPSKNSNSKNSQTKLSNCSGNYVPFCSPKTSTSDTSYDLNTSNHRYPLNVVVLGPVDAGKSTLLGHLLTLTNCVDKKLKNVDQLSWILDQGEDERDRGITIDPTKCQFNLSLKTTNKNNGSENSTTLPYDSIKVNVIDTPGHHDLIHNLVMGAVFANSAVIILDSNDVLKSELFGFYFTEHILLLYFLGIRHLVICVNKIDRFEYSEEAYNKVLKVIKKFTANYEKNVRIMFLPVSGLNGDNLVFRSEKLSWYKGPTLLEYFKIISLDIIKKPIVLYTKTICHIFDLWESSKNTVNCSCFVEGSKIKAPIELYTLPSSVQVKCVSVNYQELNLVEVDPKSSNNNITSVKPNCNYVNDFVDSLEMKGTEISNLIGSKIMVDANTHSKIKTNTSSIVKTSTFTGFIYLNEVNKMKLTIGENVELYVGYAKQSANIRELNLVENFSKLSARKLYSVAPGQFAFIEFCSYSPILVEPISRSSKCIREIIETFHSSESKEKTRKSDLNTQNGDSDHVGILSRLLVRSSGSFIAGGVVVTGN